MNRRVTNVVRFTARSFSEAVKVRREIENKLNNGRVFAGIPLLPDTGIVTAGKAVYASLDISRLSPDIQLPPDGSIVQAAIFTSTTIEEVVRENFTKEPDYVVTSAP